MHLNLFGHKTAWAGQRKDICTQVTTSDLPKSDLKVFYIWTMACYNEINKK